MWNVNVFTTKEKCIEWLELIETLWNVNFVVGHVFYDFVSGINRNIVECKYANAIHGVSEEQGINRNIVECK